MERGKVNFLKMMFFVFVSLFVFEFVSFAAAQQQQFVVFDNPQIFAEFVLDDGTKVRGQIRAGVTSSTQMSDSDGGLDPFVPGTVSGITTSYVTGNTATDGPVTIQTSSGTVNGLVEHYVYSSNNPGNVRTIQLFTANYQSAYTVVLQPSQLVQYAPQLAAANQWLFTVDIDPRYFAEQVNLNIPGSYGSQQYVTTGLPTLRTTSSGSFLEGVIKSWQISVQSRADKEVQTADINGDGKDEIVFIKGGQLNPQLNLEITLNVIDGATRTNLAGFPKTVNILPTVSMIEQLIYPIYAQQFPDFLKVLIGDVSSNPGKEIILIGKQREVVVSAQGNVIGSYELPLIGSNIISMYPDDFRFYRKEIQQASLANTDSDPESEIVLVTKERLTVPPYTSPYTTPANTQPGPNAPSGALPYYIGFKHRSKIEVISINGQSGTVVQGYPVVAFDKYSNLIGGAAPGNPNILNSLTGIPFTTPVYQTEDVRSLKSKFLGIAQLDSDPSLEAVITISDPLARVVCYYYGPFNTPPFYGRIIFAPVTAAFNVCLQSSILGKDLVKIIDLQSRTVENTISASPFPAVNGWLIYQTKLGKFENSPQYQIITLSGCSYSDSANPCPPPDNQQPLCLTSNSGYFGGSLNIFRADGTIIQGNQDSNEFFIPYIYYSGYFPSKILLQDLDGDSDVELVDTFAQRIVGGTTPLCTFATYNPRTYGTDFSPLGGYQYQPPTQASQGSIQDNLIGGFNKGNNNYIADYDKDNSPDLLGSLLKNSFDSSGNSQQTYDKGFIAVNLNNYNREATRYISDQGIYNSHYIALGNFDGDRFLDIIDLREIYSSSNSQVISNPNYNTASIQVYELAYSGDNPNAPQIFSGGDNEGLNRVPI